MVTHENGQQIKFVPLGHAVASVDSTAVGLPSLPGSGTRDRIRRVIIRALSQPINWRDDGSDPNGTTGMALLASETLVFDGDPNTFKMCVSSTATGNADVRVAYYGT